MTARVPRTKRRRGGGAHPQWCNHDGCPVQVVFARLGPNGPWAAFEARDREPFSDEAVGARVLLSRVAWRPADAIEDFQVRFEIGENQAREIVSGFPFHRIHTHRDDTPTTSTPSSTPSSTNTKETHPS